MSIRVLLADDQDLVRAGLRMILEVEDGIEVVAEASNGREAIEAAGRHRIDVALMDVRMPHLDGLGALAELERMHLAPAPRVIVLTTFDLDEYVYTALRAGASGYLLKSAAPAELVAAIRAVAAGDLLLAPSVTRRFVERYTRRGTASPRSLAGHEDLTPREREIFDMVVAGLTNREIAERLVVSPETVKTHVAAVLAKIGARDRVQAVIFAYESGLA